MSRWLVGSSSSSDVGAADQHLREQHAQLEAARQRRRAARGGPRSGSPAPRAPRWRAPRACSRRARRSSPRARPCAPASTSAARRSAMRRCSLSACHTTASPRIARSRMIAASSRKRSCRSTPTRARLAMRHRPVGRRLVAGEDPEERASCPSRWRRPGRSAIPALSCSETSSNSVRAPYSLARLVVAIMPARRLTGARRDRSRFALAG